MEPSATSAAEEEASSGLAALAEEEPAAESMNGAAGGGEEEALLARAQKLVDKILAVPANPNPVHLHALASMLETQESRLEILPLSMLSQTTGRPRSTAFYEMQGDQVPDEAVTKCTSCEADFGAFFRKHHCRSCGDIFCDKCTSGRIALTADEQAQPVRVCGKCMEEVTRRLNKAKEMAKRPPIQESHEDLSRKLQEEMEKNRRAAGGSKTFSVSSKRMREVACPTCTVHLQVKVPPSGSATVECGVCQHPFLVNAK